MFLQKTIRKSVEIDGIGLHSGEPARIVLRPAPADTGVHFVRRDLPGEPSVSVSAGHVSATQLATTLSVKEFSVSTVEHCLSALAAFRVDNLNIDLFGPEIPICDGSSLEFAKALKNVGMVEQEAARKYLYVTKPVYYGTDEKHGYILPYNGLRVSCTIDFAHPQIGLQKIDIDVNETTYLNELAPARTFGFYKDLEVMQEKGLAKGASFDNAIALDQKGVMNPESLRFVDEFVRHKALDAIGDLATLGAPLMGHVVLYKAGHDLMNRLVHQLLNSPDSYRQVELGEELPETTLDSAFMHLYN